MKMVIFGCGNIANRIAQGFKLLEKNPLVGFGSTDVKRAKQYVEKYGVEMFGTYEDFLNNPDIDAVYIATYNPSHYDLIRQCLLHNKHVMCEKPMLSTKEDVEELFSLAKEKGLMLMEAMKHILSPLTIKTEQIINDGILGDIRYIEATFIRNEGIKGRSWKWDKKYGGALKDIGSYCASIMNYLMKSEPKVLYSKSNRDDKYKESSAEVLVDYNGVNGHLVISNEFDGVSQLKIYGSKGYLTADNFWKADKIILHTDKIEEIKVEVINDFYYEIKHFIECVELGKYQSDILDEPFTKSILDITCAID